MSNSDVTAPSEEGAVARLRAAGDAAREQLATLIESALDRLLDAPLDIRDAQEALYAINPSDPAVASAPAVRRAAEWGLARMAGRVGSRFGGKVAGRAAVPVTVAVEYGLAARDGIRELQVLGSFLVNRLRAEGHPVDRDLVRRTVLAVYLDPTVRPDLRVPPHRRALRVARRWALNSLPLTGRRQLDQTRRRVDTMAGLYLSVLLEDWARVSALDVDVVPSRTVLEARMVEGPRPASGP